MVRGMFVIFGMEQSRRDDYDTDASLEYSEEEMHQQFLDFYEDALPELKNAGRVVQFKVTTVKNHQHINNTLKYNDSCNVMFKSGFLLFTKSETKMFLLVIK